MKHVTAVHGTMRAAVGLWCRVSMAHCVLLLVFGAECPWHIACCCWSLVQCPWHTVCCCWSLAQCPWHTACCCWSLVQSVHGTLRAAVGLWCRVSMAHCVLLLVFGAVSMAHCVLLLVFGAKCPWHTMCCCWSLVQSVHGTLCAAVGLWCRVPMAHCVLLLVFGAECPWHTVCCCWSLVQSHIKLHGEWGTCLRAKRTQTLICSFHHTRCNHLTIRFLIQSLPFSWREPDHPPPSSAQIRNEWSNTSVTPRTRYR